jgi:hypothetical protein
VDVRVEQGSGGLGGWPVEDGSDTCRVGGYVWSMLLAGGLVVWVSKPSVAGFTGLGLKT